MLARAAGGPVIREGDPVDRSGALRKDAAHEGAPAVHRSELVAEPQITHALPSHERLDPGVERLCLPHAGAARDDDEVGGLKARGELVEPPEPGGEPGDVFLAVVQPLDVLEGVLEDRADGDRAPLQAPLRDLKDEPLGLVEEGIDVVALLVALADDLGRGADQVPEQSLLADDVGVGDDVGGRGRLLDERGEGGGAADLLERVAAPELLGEGQEIDRLGALEERHHRREDLAMAFLVEVRGAEDFDRAGQTLSLQQEGAQHRSLGFEAVRRDPGAQQLRERRHALLPDDYHLELRRHLGMQPDRNHELAEALDGLLDQDPALLDRDVLPRQEVGEILGRHRPEQLALLRRLPPLLADERLDPRAEALGLGLDARRLRLLLGFDLGEVLQISRRRGERALLRDQKVPRVPVRHLSHLAPAAESADVVQQNDLHDLSPLDVGRLIRRRTAATPPSGLA